MLLKVFSNALVTGRTHKNLIVIIGCLSIQKQL